MHAIFEIAKAIIHQYSYIGFFMLTALDQFIFPFPVDLLITIATSIGLTLKKLMPIVCIAALLGSVMGYLLGKFLGHPVCVKLFGRERLDKGEAFIKKWGMPGVIIAGFTPLPFQIITWAAGIFEMPFYKFIIAVIIGRFSRYFIVALAGIFVFKSKFYATTEMSALILGTLQGITEFLPISSSGHLVILEQFLNLPIEPKQLAMFDIILHGGSLLAIIIYFWRDWIKVLKEIWIMLSKWTFDKQSMAFKLVIGTIPAIIAGLILGKAVAGPLRNIHIIAFFFIALAFLYFYASWKGQKNESENITLKKSVLIGLAQAIALVPGISRSGMTIATGLISGIKKEMAAKFSFMLGAVAIFAANIYALFSIERGAVIPDLTFTMLGFATSFIFSLIAIAFLLKYLEKHTMRAFGLYLLLIGVLILSFM
jgi:undecaprenyl-diphosphatase